MNERHAMVLVHRSGTELVFQCEEDECGRRLMIDPARGRRVVIDQGDVYAGHYGGTGEITMAVSVEQADARRMSEAWTPDLN